MLEVRERDQTHPYSSMLQWQEGKPKPTPESLEFYLVSQRLAKLDY